MAKKIDVGGELNSTALDKKLVDAAQVKDSSRGEKTLVETNEEIEYLLAQEGERQKQFEANEAARQAEADKTEQDRADEAARTEAERQATFEANEAERQVLYEKVAKNTEGIEFLNANTGVSEYPEFSEAKAYAVGEVVLYEGLLKRFTSAHAAGAWDASQVVDWSERKEVDEKIGALEETIVNSSNTENFDLGFCDEEGNVVAKFENGHIKTKYFDSSKDATSKERGLMSAKDKDKLDNLDVETDNGSNDFSITDEAGNAILALKDGHLEVKNFSSKDATTGMNLKDAYTDGDLNLSDENGNIVLKLKDGHIQTKEFDSSIAEIVEPVFYAEKGSNTVSSSIMEAEKGDLVKVRNVNLVNTVTVSEYSTNKGTTPIVTANIDKGGLYVIKSDKTTFIKIQATPNESDAMMIDGVLYSNASFVKNIVLYKKRSSSPAFRSLIKNGWYISKKSEFSSKPEDISENTGEKLSLSSIYGKLNELAENYNDYMVLEALGYDSSSGKPAHSEVYSSAFAEWTDPSGNLNIPVYKIELNPSNVNVEGLKCNSADRLPTIYMQFGIHAGEPPIIRGLMNFLIHLCRDWESDEFLRYIRWNCRLVIIPVLVPYSYIDLNSTPTINGRCNYNGVNIARNYYGNGMWNEVPSTEGRDYKGPSYLSEVETRYSMRTLLESGASIAFDWHTHGVFTSWENMTCFAINESFKKNEVVAAVARYVIRNLTISGWLNHMLPKESGYIGFTQASTAIGGFTDVVNDMNIPTASPEGLYRYYSGEAAIVYNEYTDCMNEEMIANTVLESLRNTF